MPSDAPPWAAGLFLEMHRLNNKIDALHATLAMHVVDRREAAEILGCSTKTVFRYEKADRLPRANVPMQGAHYFRSDVLAIKQAP